MTEIQIAADQLRAAQERVLRVGVMSCRALLRGGFRMSETTSEDRLAWWREAVDLEFPGEPRSPAPPPSSGGDS